MDKQIVRKALKNNPLHHVKKKYHNKTNKQLEKWGLKFDELILGKPSYDIFIDDKCFNVKEKKTLKKLDQFINEK